MNVLKDLQSVYLFVWLKIKNVVVDERMVGIQYAGSTSDQIPGSRKKTEKCRKSTI